MPGISYEPEGVEDEFENNVEETDEPFSVMWGEFSYQRFDKPTNRWDTKNYEPDEWELFLEESGEY